MDLCISGCRAEDQLTYIADVPSLFSGSLDLILFPFLFNVLITVLNIDHILAIFYTYFIKNRNFLSFHS